MLKLTALILLLSITQCYLSQSCESFYIGMSDGVKLAADVYLPKKYSGEKLPVLIQFERYWRSAVKRKNKGQKPKLYGRAKYFSDNGYALVIVDTRGSGASFGTRLSEYSPQEVNDASDVLDWVIEQTWSNGKVGSYGTSYTGTTAELLCATKHPSLKAHSLPSSSKIVAGPTSIFIVVL